MSVRTALYKEIELVHKRAIDTLKSMRVSGCKCFLCAVDRVLLPHEAKELKDLLNRIDDGVKPDIIRAEFKEYVQTYAGMRVTIVATIKDANPEKAALLALNMVGPAPSDKDIGLDASSDADVDGDSDATDEGEEDVDEEEEEDSDENESEEDDEQESDDDEEEQTGMSTATKKTAAQKDVEIVRHGEQIIVPPGMSYKDARLWLERKERADEQFVAINETVDAFPMEGAFAFAKAMARKYGFTQMVPTPGFFQDTPPAMIGVDIGLNETAQVPWGRVEIPGVAGHLQTAIGWKDDHFVLTITGEVKTKHKDEVKALVDLTRAIVRDESIYRGKAIRVSFPERPDPRLMDPTKGPVFLDVKNVREQELIFSEDVGNAVDVGLFALVEYTQHCRDNGIPLKRGVLLEGPFGVGKTLTAYVTAKKCEENGWTFIYVDKVKSLKQAIHFARAYQPAVIFAEDIDSVMQAEDDRTEEIDEILNTIDGVDTKNQELIVVLTSNNAEDIEKAMVRPGRIDTIVKVTPPDSAAAVRLIHLYARGTLDPSSDLTKVGEKLNGQIPAVIREVVERSKLAAIVRAKGGANLTITSRDLEVAADTMVNHLKLMKPKAPDLRQPIEKAADSLGATLRSVLVASQSNGHKDNGRPSTRALPAAG